MVCFGLAYTESVATPCGNTRSFNLQALSYILPYPPHCCTIPHYTPEGRGGVVRGALQKLGNVKLA